MMSKPFFRMLRLFTMLSILCWSQLNGQEVGVVAGTVQDEHGMPLEYVNVFFTDGSREGSLGEGAMTNEAGQFRIETRQRGRRTLRVSHIGYEQKDVVVDVSPHQPVNVTVQLEASLVRMEAVTISAGSFTMADEEGHTLTSLDVVTTAGAAADIFRAIQTLPGVNQVDEGAGMFVRGGDVSETVILLDQATLIHPYRYESDTGGYFGTINPFLLAGTYFSSGAFSAKYGNALSGILAMESLGMPKTKSLQIGWGLASLSLGGSYPIVPERLGVRLSGNYSNTETLFRVNGGTDRFGRVPISWDGNLSMIYKSPHGSQLKFFNYYNQDDIGVRFDSPTFSGMLVSGTENLLNNLQWQHAFGGKFLVKSSLSRAAFRQEFAVGNLGLTITDGFLKWRTDSVHPVSKKIRINGGLEVDRLASTITGSVPEDENDLSPNAPTRFFSTEYTTNHGGGYLEGEVDFTQRLFAIGGLRMDYLDGSQDMTVDPRLSLGYRISDTQILKFATGVYHQYPKVYYRDQDHGNPDLKPLQAMHYVAGYELKSELVNFRTELYFKDYQHLPLEDPVENYRSDGHGFAYGADVFLKGNLPLISGWISYSYLVSKREELAYLKLVPTDYDIRHNFTAALKTLIGSRNSISLTYRYTSGKPFTPALNRWNSDRLPSIQRLDLSWSFFTFYGGDDFFVVYAAVSNLLDRQNIYGYLYNPDYSERTELKSSFGRNIYFGFTTSLR